jgi:arabinan endo-1,5-alpha-L-arabinosidase
MRLTIKMLKALNLATAGCVTPECGPETRSASPPVAAGSIANSRPQTFGVRGHDRAQASLPLFALATLLCLCLLTLTTEAQPDSLSGNFFIHDPSTIVQDQGTYYVFGTRPGIGVRASTNLLEWHAEPPVFKHPPSWALAVAPGFDGYFWAPDIIHLNDKFYLYYAVSAWGKQTSAIGLATSPTLDHTATKYAWTDNGLIIQSTNGSPYNTIDPSVMRDADGSLWLAFGSYWKGIFLTQLDASTGRRISTNSPLYHLAWNDSIEAACLMRHGTNYYLFVDWGQCCRGTNSTYEVRVGRAETITGPYLDQQGSDLAVGGGSKFLGNEGRFIGPGHIGILEARGSEWISYHTYDAKYQGRSRLYLRKLDWTLDGWPVAGEAVGPAN